MSKAFESIRQGLNQAIGHAKREVATLRVDVQATGARLVVRLDR